ncbi:MAG: ArsR family transcriptional regulator [Nitrososphaerota archaeon]|nr:ArsR family transcriptional regulator [Nitrososphaerota archaeon]
MESEELNRILQVVENPVRKKIIKRLSQEPAYQLQLSKELGLGQSLVAKHLKIMSNAGLVTRSQEDSESGGPKTWKYSLVKGVSITMDLGPNLFIERGSLFGLGPKRKRSEAVQRFRDRVEEAVSSADDAKKLVKLSGVLDDVDGRMEEIEDERTELLAVRNLAMSEAARVASRFEEVDTRKVLLHVLDEHDREVGRISEALNLREFSVRSILRELEDFLE